MTDVDTLLDWAHTGQRHVEEAVATLDPDDVAAPSALPGWTRGHLITHLARNADALVNLLTWARTGHPTPMYSNPEQRHTDIEAGANRGLTEQLQDLRATGERFTRTAAELPAKAWETRVKSAQGRDIPAAEVPWLRVREVWIHLVDLAVGHSVDGIPDDVAAELVRDVSAWMSPKLTDTVLLRPDDHPDTILGPQNAPTVSTITGPANRIAGWLTGRSSPELLHHDGMVPELPRWL